MHANPLLIPTAAGALLLFWLGGPAGRAAWRPAKWAARVAAALLAAPGLLFVVYYAHLFDGAAWFYRFRALPGTELSAAGLGFAAGVAGAAAGSTARKIAWGATALVLVLVPFVKPILTPLDLDRLRGQPRDGVVLQTTFSSCGPAVAATLLDLLGHPASEQELAREAFTSRGGTENWYLARALRRRGFEVTFEIQPASSNVIPSPAIAGVVLRGGAGHFIAVLDSTGDTVTIVDPLDGKHTLAGAALADRYRFTGFFMTVRRPASP